MSMAEDISRNLTEITAIASASASANPENVERTQAASHALHDLSGELSKVTQRLTA